jgi:hypothetical protein
MYILCTRHFGKGCTAVLKLLIVVLSTDVFILNFRPSDNNWDQTWNNFSINCYNIVSVANLGLECVVSRGTGFGNQPRDQLLCLRLIKD